jgi:hypothetical protein
LIGVRSRGVFGVPPGAMNDPLSRWLVKRRPVEDPGTVRQGMNPFDLTGFGGEPERLRCNAEETRGIGQVEPWLFPVRRWPEDRDFVMRPEGSDSLACPSIAVAGHQPVPVQDAGNQIIVGDQHQLADSRDVLGRGAVALPTTSLRQAQFRVDAANPMDQEHDLRCCIVDIGDHLVDDGTHDALLEPRIRRRRRPDSPKISGQRRDVRCR